ncbi:porin [Pelagibacterales bacterium SAG-MED48]|nr:porin [Pelagibacterales bacterium SAG-MED48]
MTNFKKIGMTALAGSLAAIGYAQAGALDVTGTARMEYQSTTSAAGNSGDSFAQNTSISFSGSGELDNGMNVSYFSLQAAGGNNSSSQSVALDMGDAGTLTMSNYNMAGIGMIQDKVPNGGEQPWDDLGTHGSPQQGVASPHSGDRLGYSTSVAGATISAAIDYQQSSPTTSLAVSMAVMEGFEVGAGMATDQSAPDVEDDITTMYAKYTMGGISVGYQTTEVEPETSNTNIERTAYGVSFAVNDNLSVGYGVSDTDFDTSATDEENTGIGIAYTSGGMKLGIINNTKDNAGGTAGGQDEMTELQLTFAF